MTILSDLINDAADVIASIAAFVIASCFALYLIALVSLPVLAAVWLWRAM